MTVLMGGGGGGSGGSVGGGSGGGGGCGGTGSESEVDTHREKDVVCGFILSS